MKRRFDELKSGMKIHSIVAGDKKLPALVLLHGYPTNAFLWRHCIPTLSKHFRVYAPDLPGYGESEKDLDFTYDLDFYIAFLNEYFEALNIKKTNLCVHDIGGQIGLGFVARHQEKINKFVVMDCLVYQEWSKGMMQFYKYVNSPFWSWILRCKPVFSYQFFRDKRIVFDSKNISKKIIDNYHSQWTKNKTSKKVFSKAFSAAPEKITEPRENLKRIKVPTLILWATEDFAMKIDIARKLNSDISNSELKLIPECGHFVPEEQPGLITKYILEFMLKS